MWSCVLLCLVVTTSCSLKTGMNDLYNYDQTLGIHEEPFRYWQWELYSPRIVADHVDLALGIGYNLGKEEGVMKVEEVDKRWPRMETNMWDIHLGARFFPLGVADRKIVPYLGGGMGYFEYNVETNSPGEFVCNSEDGYYYKVDKKHDTLAHGYFNYLSIGLYLSLNKNFMLQTEFRHDFDKDHRQFDLSGYQVTIGLACMHD